MFERCMFDNFRRGNKLAGAPRWRHGGLQDQQ